MLRSFVLGACLTCLTLGTGQADEPCPLRRLPGTGHPPDIWSTRTLDSASAEPETCCPPVPRAISADERSFDIPGTCEPDQGLPRSERDFLVQQQWKDMPAFEIFEDPLPSPMALAHPQICFSPCCAETTDPQAVKPRYAVAHAAPAVATVSDEPPTPIFSHLSVPTPLADPAAMVVQLFEKLKASEERAAEANRRLAAAQAELESLRVAPMPSQSVPAGDMVVLEVRCFEIDLQALAESDVELIGVCKQDLSRSGLYALVTQGAFEAGCPCTGVSKVAAGPAKDNGPCSSCTDCPATQVLAQGPAASDTSSCGCRRGEAIENTEIFERILGQLEEAGVIRNISQPRSMTRSGESARMMVGRQFAVTTAAAEEGQAPAGVETCTAGTKVEARPVVLSDGTVQIELHAEWSAVNEDLTATSGRPVLDRRVVATNLELPAGKTAVVAGLMQHQTAAEVGTVGIPVPGKNCVFRNVGRPASGGRKELVVLITPKVIAPIARVSAEEVQR